MSRIALAVEYDGSRYHGWQRQQDVDSVQARLEAALSQVANSPIDTVCAGRTDAGVHATYQVVHFDSDAIRPDQAWLFGGTHALPADISIVWARTVCSDFHARFSATARSYRYVILNRQTRSAVHQGRVTWWRDTLNAEAMHKAGQFLLGEHDFSSFRAKGCQAKSPIRTIESCRVQRQGDFIYIDITANAFLHHMVRNIVGTLLPIGAGIRPVDSLFDILGQQQRVLAGITAPAAGLYLVNVRYPAAFFIPEPRAIPAFYSPLGEIPVVCC
ncbi:MAG: tRNA pseudouridine(38-40) synthase TruA [Halothiobacillus sp.]